MQIKVNGKTQEFAAPLTVAAMAEILQLNTKQVAIERNREIVPKSQYKDVALTDGDEVEIVKFIGGG